MQFDLNAHSIMDHLSSLSYKSNLVQDNASQSSTSHNTPNHILANRQSEISSDPYQRMLDHSVAELKNLLTEICKEGNTLLQNLQTSLPNSNLTRLEAMIPRLNEASGKLKKNLSPEKYGEQNAHGKREVNDDEEDEEIIQEEAASHVNKKVKQDSTHLDSPEVIFIGTAFSLKFILHKDIESLMPPEKKRRYADWDSNGSDSSILLKREDFLCLQGQVTLRLSKEHAQITARDNGTAIMYEITDLSVNGTYYFGNKLDGALRAQPARLQKGMPFQLKNGDVICLLMKKGTQAPEMLLGFEFCDS